ncbi:MAG: thymidylate synthase [Nanoarchaeota archaeon]|nr:thymidylate synthase [Nanoarchaeota archaeon]
MIEPRDNPHLNPQDKQFHQYMYNVLTSHMLNFRDAARTVVPTIGTFGDQITYDLRDGTVPLSMTKPIGIKSQLLPELAGFLQGQNNLRWYRERGMKIWDKNAFNFFRSSLEEDHPWSNKNIQKDTPEFLAAVEDYVQLVMSGENPKSGDLGNFYPVQWRSFKGLKNNLEAPAGFEIVEVDQINNLVEELINRPTNRYAIVTAWNPVDVKFNQAALAPCHNMFMAYRYEDVEGIDRVSVKLFQRSADIFAGVNFNNIQYSLFTKAVAKVVGAQAGEFIHSFGDNHFYCGHKDAPRHTWYKDKKNLQWLQSELKDPSIPAEETLDNLLKKLPSEENLIGYDHVPYVLKQLSRNSTMMTAPKAEILATSLDTIDVDDFKITGYKYKTPERPETILINGYKDQMAS